MSIESGSAEHLISDRVKPRKRGVLAYEKNPFWKPTEVKVGQKKVTISGGFVANADTGEGMHHAGIHRFEEVDEDRFVKLFTQNIKLFFDLSSASQKVLQCVLATLQENPNADGIHLPWFTVLDYSTEKGLKISRSSFQRALKEMLEKGFIAESENPNFYWINPHLFFNGDRMVFITEYRKKSKKKMFDQVEQAGKMLPPAHAADDHAGRKTIEDMGQQRFPECS